MLALGVAHITRQTASNQKYAEISLAQSNLLGRIRVLMYNSKACENTLKKGTVTPGQTLTALYKDDDTVSMSVGDLFDKVIKISALSLKFQATDLTSKSGGNKGGNINLSVEMERVSKVFKGPRKIRRDVELAVTVGASNQLVSCQHTHTDTQTASIVSESRKKACLDLGGTYDATATPPCSLSNSGAAQSLCTSIGGSYDETATPKCSISSSSSGKNALGGPKITKVVGRGGRVEYLPYWPMVTYGAFALLRSDGSIRAWGNLGSSNSAPWDSGYTEIVANESAFAARKSDGSITAWGGNGATGGPTDSGYVEIVASKYAFAARKSDGSIFAWGHSSFGGTGEPTDSGYVEIVANAYAFAARKSDGRLRPGVATAARVNPRTRGMWRLWGTVLPLRRGRVMGRSRPGVATAARAGPRTRGMWRLWTILGPLRRGRVTGRSRPGVVIVTADMENPRTRGMWRLWQTMGPFLPERVTDPSRPGAIVVSAARVNPRTRGMWRLWQAMGPFLPERVTDPSRPGAIVIMVPVENPRIRGMWRLWPMRMPLRPGRVMDPSRPGAMIVTGPLGTHGLGVCGDCAGLPCLCGEEE